MKTQIKEIEQAIAEMCDLRLTTHNFNGKTVTKEELYDILDEIKEKNEKFKEIAIFSEKMDRSEMICSVVDRRTIKYSILNESNDVYGMDWEFKINQN